MTTPTENWIWGEGEDLTLSLVYKEGPQDFEVPIDLTGYKLRMDVVSTTGTRVFTFNSDDIDEAGVDVVGPADNEVVMGPALGQIKIVVPRAITLPGGPVAALLTSDQSLLLNYDIFLRNPSDKQSKIMRGTITVERSYTKWL